MPPRYRDYSGQTLVLFSQALLVVGLRSRISGSRSDLCFAQPAGRNAQRRPPMKNPRFAQLDGAAMLAALALAFALVSCAPSYHEKGEHYILIAANINLPYWQEADAGLRDVAKEMGIEVKADMDGPTSYSPKEEVDALQRAVSQHP